MPVGHNTQMPKKSRAHPKPRPEYAKTYLQEWLTYRNKTHEQLAEFLGITRPQVTKIVNGKRPYSQSILEAAAEYLETDPASLLMRDPTQPESIWSIWEHAKPGDREEIRRYAEFVTGREKRKA